MLLLVVRLVTVWFTKPDHIKHKISLWYTSILIYMYCVLALNELNKDVDC